MAPLPADGSIRRDIGRNARSDVPHTVSVNSVSAPIRTRLPAEAFFVLGAISQYIGAAWAITTFDDLDARAVAWLRVVFAAVIAIGLTRAWRADWSRAELFRAIPFGIVLGFMNLFFYIAIDRLPLGTAVAIEFIGPITVAAWGSRTRHAILSLLLAFAGVALLSEISFRGDPVGLLFIFLAAACWAGYIVLGHRFAGGARGLGGLGVAMGIGAIAMVPFAAPVSGPAWFDLGLMGIIALVGLLSNVIPYGLDQVVMRRLDPSRFALLLALLPVTATAIGAIALGQRPSPLEISGIALVVAGIATRDRRGERVPATIALEP
jgi:inner membrane transporter RhtA